MKSYVLKLNHLRQTVFKRGGDVQLGGTPLGDRDDQVKKVAQAISQLEARDRVGVIGDGAVVAGSTLAGAALSGVAAGAAGATSLLGSTSLAGLLGGVFVTTTPVGWVIGSAAVVGAVGYGAVKLIRSGAQQDRVRKEISQRLSARLVPKVDSKLQTSSERQELESLISSALDANVLSLDSGKKILDLVDAGSLNLNLALIRMRTLTDNGQG
ncbi:hypothetical protein ACQKEN_03615 [Pseudomonas sp. NPDC078416]|uniref:hypothetical protein n=1 Tax=Pseudomonas sp. NPDC078416 TaxID=3390637 RepID=UPI003CFF899D